MFFSVGILYLNILDYKYCIEKVLSYKKKKVDYLIWLLEKVFKEKMVFQEGGDINRINNRENF